jgi:two-component system secretion response regulator SsrB
MTQPSTSCVLLADRHHQLIECVRDMIETEFATMFIVADESSLLEGASRLKPAVVILDLSLVPGRLPGVLRRLRTCSPHSKTLLLSVQDGVSVARFGREVQADGVVLKRAIATDLLPAIDAVLANRRFESPGIAPETRGESCDTAEDPR